MTDRPSPLVSLALVAAGGCCGASARYGVATLVATPLGTLVANVLGCCLLGALTADVAPLRDLPARYRLLVATGFVSSLTTYSTFAVETAGTTVPLAAGYVVASYGLGFGSVVAGRLIATALGPREGVA